MVTKDEESRPGRALPDEAADKPAASDEYAAGELIQQKYKLLRRLGVGGMGEVWAAHSETLDIEVAIKLIRESTSDHTSHERLLREARLAARLQDPAIIRIFDVGTSEKGDPYIVMELLKGEDLASHLERVGAHTPEYAVRLLLPVLRALETIHDAGVVHRDLKPENIFLSRRANGVTQPKLLDFGIAKLEKSVDLRLTHTGILVGSPCFMSPEQARGEEANTLSDLWSFCVVLYETVTGRLPFTGNNYNALLQSILKSDPLSFAEAHVLDDHLWDIVQRGLAKDTKARWPNAQKLGDALAAYLLQRKVTHDVSGVALRASWAVETLKERPVESQADTVSSDRIQRDPTHTNYARSHRQPPGFAAKRSLWYGLLGAALLGTFAWLFLGGNTDPGKSASASASPTPIETKTRAASQGRAEPLPGEGTPTVDVADLPTAGTEEDKKGITIDVAVTDTDAPAAAPRDKKKIPVFIQSKARPVKQAFPARQARQVGTGPNAPAAEPIHEPDRDGAEPENPAPPLEDFKDPFE